MVALILTHGIFVSGSPALQQSASLAGDMQEAIGRGKLYAHFSKSLHHGQVGSLLDVHVEAVRGGEGGKVDALAQLTRDDADDAHHQHKAKRGWRGPQPEQQRNAKKLCAESH